MESHIKEKSKKKEAINSKDVYANFALGGIATSAFGIDLDTYQEDQNVFVKMVNEVMRGSGSEAGTSWEVFKLVLVLNFPILSNFIKVETFSYKGTSFLSNSLRKTIQMRKENKSNRKRNDIIDLVIEIEENKSTKDEVEAPEDDFEKDASIDITGVKAEIDMETTLVSSAFLLFIAALGILSLILEELCASTECHKLLFISFDIRPDFISLGLGLKLDIFFNI